MSPRQVPLFFIVFGILSNPKSKVQRLIVVQKKAGEKRSACTVKQHFAFCSRHVVHYMVMLFCIVTAQTVIIISVVCCE